MNAIKLYLNRYYLSNMFYLNEFFVKKEKKGIGLSLMPCRQNSHNSVKHGLGILAQATHWTNQKPGWLGKVMNKHDPAQHHEKLSRTRRPTHRPGAVHPGLQGENRDPIGTF